MKGDTVLLQNWYLFKVKNIKPHPCKDRILVPLRDSFQNFQRAATSFLYESPRKMIMFPCSQKTLGGPLNSIHFALLLCQDYRVATGQEVVRKQNTSSSEKNVRAFYCFFFSLGEKYPKGRRVLYQLWYRGLLSKVQPRTLLYTTLTEKPATPFSITARDVNQKTNII